MLDLENPGKISMAGQSILQGIGCPPGTDFGLGRSCLRMICWQFPHELRDKAKAFGDFGTAQEAQHSVPFAFLAVPAALFPKPASRKSRQLRHPRSSRSRTGSGLRVEGTVVGTVLVLRIGGFVVLRSPKP